MSADLIEEWERESNSMYSGYVQCWIYEGREYWVDSSKRSRMEEMGAKLQPIALLEPPA